MANGRLPPGQKVINGHRNSAWPRHRTVWCAPDSPGSGWIQQSTATNPNDRLMWQTPNNEQCHVRWAPDCLVRPSIESCYFLSNDYIGGGGYKYNSNHLHSVPPSIQYIHIQYKSKKFIPKHIQSFQSPQVPQLRQVISDLRECDLCFICCSCCLPFLSCFLHLLLNSLSDL